MQRNPRTQALFHVNRTAAFGFTLALTLAATLAAARAETRTFGCGFVSRYSAGEALTALSYVRHAVGAVEASSLYGHFASLKSECRSNPDAKRVVKLSPAVVAIIAGN